MLAAIVGLLVVPLLLDRDRSIGALVAGASSTAIIAIVLAHLGVLAAVLGALLIRHRGRR